MLGLLSSWLGLVELITSAIMVVYRPAFHDLVLLIHMYFMCPLSMTFGGLVLWSTRREKSQFAGVRLQAQVGITMAVLAAAIVYLLVALAEPINAA